MSDIINKPIIYLNTWTAWHSLNTLVISLHFVPSTLYSYPYTFYTLYLPPVCGVLTPRLWCTYSHIGIPITLHLNLPLLLLHTPTHVPSPYTYTGTLPLYNLPTLTPTFSPTPVPPTYPLYPCTSYISPIPLYLLPIPYTPVPPTYHLYPYLLPIPYTPTPIHTPTLLMYNHCSI